MQRTVGTLNQEKSEVLVRNLVRASIGTLCWLRQVFEDECFEDRALAGMTVKKLRQEGGTEESRQVRGWIEDGVFDALKKKFLDTVIFGITLDADHSDLIWESYSFKIQFPEISVTRDSSPQPVEEDSQQQGSQSSQFATISLKTCGTGFDAIRTATTQLLRNIAVLTQTLNPLPSSYSVFMKILYRDSVTPEDYEPPHFKAAPADRLLFVTTPLRVRLGKVTTDHHVVELSLASAADSLAPTKGQLGEKEIEEARKYDTDRDAELLADSPQVVTSGSQSSASESQQSQPVSPEGATAAAGAARPLSNRRIESKKQDVAVMPCGNTLWLIGLEYMSKCHGKFLVSSLDSDLGVTRQAAKGLIQRLTEMGCLWRKSSARGRYNVNTAKVLELLESESVRTAAARSLSQGSDDMEVLQAAIPAIAGPGEKRTWRKASIVENPIVRKKARIQGLND